MSAQLQAAIEGVYKVFEDVPRPAVVEGCPCCIDEKGISILLSKPLRDLSPDDLTHYASSVFLTVGSAEDFFYFLPRILEILALESGWWPDPEVVTRALYTSGFQTWPASRCEAVHKYFDEILSTLMDKEGSGFEMDSWICALGRLHIDLKHFLNRITANKPRLIEFYEVNRDELVDGRLANNFWDDAPQECKLVIDWFQSAEIKKIIKSA